MDRHDLVWNPWHGCHKHSEGCRNCYAFFLDKRYGRDTNAVARNKSGFDVPFRENENKRITCALSSKEFLLHPSR